MREIAIELGGEQIAVPRLTVRAEAEWRRLAKPITEPLVEMAMAAGLTSPTPERLAKFGMTAIALFDPEPLLAAVCGYGPELAARRGWIEEHAYTDELLLAVLTLFFGQTAPAGPEKLANGAAPPPPPTISPS